MQIILKKLLPVSFLLLMACGHDHSEAGHTHSHDEATTTDAQGHNAHEESSIVQMTDAQMKSVEISLGNIEYKALTSTIKANGVLRVPNNQKGNATSLYGGVIQTLNVHIGDVIKKGDVVATIANPQFFELQEEFISINSRIVLAEQEYQRQKELFEGNAGARKNLQAATAQRNTLRTRKASLRRQIEMMGINPSSISNSKMRSSLVVTSPINGTVSNVFAKIGSYVDASAPVIEIVDNSSLHLDLQVFEKDLPKMRVGQIIHFTITNNPGKEYDARVFSIGSSFENESKTIGVHCAVTGNKSGLIDGMNVTALVSLNENETPAVPNEAIVQANGKYYVFVQTTATDTSSKKDKQPIHYFEKIEVVKGVSDLGFTAITPVKDIEATTKIVTQGAFFFEAKLSNSGAHSH